MQACPDGQVVDGCLVCAGGVLDAAAGRGCGELGEAGCQEAVVGAGEEHGAGQAGVGDAVAVAVGDAPDEAVFFEAAQVIGGLAGCDRAGRAAGVVSEQGTQVGVDEPAGLQPEDEQDVQQGLGAGVGEAQSGGAGAVVVDYRVAGGLEGFGAADRVVAESLGVQ